MRSDFDLESRPAWTFSVHALEGHDHGNRWPAATAGVSIRPQGPVAVRVARRFRASPERVFSAWLDGRTAGQWLFATASRPIVQVDIDPRPGGEFRFVERRRGSSTEYAGRYLQIVPSRRLVFTLTIDHGPESTVTVEIVPRRVGSELIVSQRPVPLPERERTEGRWSGILYGLGLVLDAATHPGQTRS